MFLGIVVVDVDMRMHIKVIRKRLLHSHESNFDFRVLLKSDEFLISFPLSVKNSFQGAGTFTGNLYFDLLN